MSDEKAFIFLYRKESYKFLHKETTIFLGQKFSFHYTNFNLNFILITGTKMNLLKTLFFISYQNDNRIKFKISSEHGV